MQLHVVYNGPTMYIVKNYNGRSCEFSLIGNKTLLMKYGLSHYSISIDIHEHGQDNHQVTELEVAEFDITADAIHSKIFA